MHLSPATASAARKVPWGGLRLRHARVVWFFARVVASVVWWDILLRRVGLRSLARRTASARYRRLAQRFRALAAELGGVWIKVGQFLSARVDMLPESVTAELAGLQDEVTPEPLEAMRGVIEEELGARVESGFEWFDPKPLASASLGQVHRARLRNGHPVVVKVQRPHIHALIRTDLTALTVVIGWLKRYRPIRRRADLDALVEEFSRTLWEEVDYLAEAENARRFAALFADDPDVRIPAVHKEVTTRRVLTLEDVYFIKITDYAAIEAAGVDRIEVAGRLFRTYLRQIFDEGFFHADPHPGNLFVEPLPEGGWRLVFVDFGMVGRLSADVKAGLREVAIAVGTRDPDRVIRAYQLLGVLLPGADLERIRQAETRVFERFWGKSMRELRLIHPQEMRQFSREFRDLLFEMPFQLPADLIYLGRCLAILSGMCTGLNPEFNVFEGLAPFARELVAEEGQGWVEGLLEVLVTQGKALAALPSELSSTLRKMQQGTLVVTARAAPELEQQLRILSRAINRLVGAVLFLALLVVGALMVISGRVLVGAVCLVLAMVVLGWILVG